MSVDSSSTLNTTDVVSTADSLTLKGTYTVNVSSITSTGAIVSAAPTVITIPGPNVPVPTVFVTGTVTAKPPYHDPFQTPSCTTPYFAVVTDRAQVPHQYPQIGCSQWHQDCCLYSFQDSVLLKQCPPGFVTRSSGSYRACCPNDYDLLNTGVGRVTPCYSPLAIPYVPATTVTNLNRHLITDSLFALSYPLAPRRKVPVGPIVGGVVGGLFLLTLGVFLLRWRTRHRRDSMPSPPLECRQREAEALPPQPPPKLHPSRGVGHRGYYHPKNGDDNYHAKNEDDNYHSNNGDTTYHVALPHSAFITTPPRYHDSLDLKDFAELPAPALPEHPSKDPTRLQNDATTSPADQDATPENVISPLSIKKSPC